jgi:hypothetical protein
LLKEIKDQDFLREPVYSKRLSSLVFRTNPRTVTTVRIKTGPSKNCKAENLDLPGCFICERNYVLHNRNCYKKSSSSPPKTDNSTNKNAYLADSEWNFYILNRLTDFKIQTTKGIPVVETVNRVDVARSGRFGGLAWRNVTIMARRMQKDRLLTSTRQQETAIYEQSYSEDSELDDTTSNWPEQDLD